MDEQAFKQLLEQAGRLSPAQLKQFIIAYAEQNGQDGKWARFFGWGRCRTTKPKTPPRFCGKWECPPIS